MSATFRHQQQAEPVSPRSPRTIDSWAARRVGKQPERITTSDVLNRIRPVSGLRYRSRLTGSPLGGRIAPHLRHLEDEEAIDLLSRADAFLADTHTDDSPAPVDRGLTDGPREARSAAEASTGTTDAPSAS
jgi:hypothetical protein